MYSTGFECFLPPHAVRVISPQPSFGAERAVGACVRAARQSPDWLRARPLCAPALSAAFGRLAEAKSHAGARRVWATRSGDAAGYRASARRMAAPASAHAEHPASAEYRLRRLPSPSRRGWPSRLARALRLASPPLCARRASRDCSYGVIASRLRLPCRRLNPFVSKAETGRAQAPLLRNFFNRNLMLDDGIFIPTWSSNLHCKTNVSLVNAYKRATFYYFFHHTFVRSM